MVGRYFSATLPLPLLDLTFVRLNYAAQAGLSHSQSWSSALSNRNAAFLGRRCMNELASSESNPDAFDLSLPSLRGTNIR